MNSALQRRGQRTVGWASTAVFLICLDVFLGIPPACSAVTDADVMLELVSNMIGVEQYFAGWNPANLVNYCTWAGVTCDTNSRVTSIELAWSMATTITASIPRSIASLTELKYLALSQHFIVGDIPAELFQLPNITNVGLANTGVTITWPSTFSPKLQSLDLGGVTISAPLPANLPWDSMTRFTAMRSNIRCPFPDSALNFLQNGSVLCDLLENPLTSINGKVCGQIPTENMRCGFASRIEEPIDFTASTPLPTPTHVIVKSGFQIEVVGHSIMFFATRNVSGKLEPFREEYVSFVQNPLFVGQGMARPYTWSISVFKPGIRWVSDDEFRINSTLMGGIFEVEWRFVFNSPNSNIQIGDGASLKFTVACYRIQPYTYPDGVDSVTMPFSIVYRVPHSNVTGSSIKCDKFNRICNSTITSLVFEANVFGQATVFTSTMTSEKVKVIFSYAAVGSIDGAPMTADNTDVDVNRYFYPVGSDDFLESYVAWDPTMNFPGGPLSNQYSALFVYITARLFNESMIYDPDISIQLLFDSGEASPADRMATEIGLGVAVIAVIAVSAAVVVLAASVTAFKFLIWPRLVHESVMRPLASNVVNDEELQPAQSSSSPRRATTTGWQTGHASHSRITNQEAL